MALPGRLRYTSALAIFPVTLIGSGIASGATEFNRYSVMESGITGVFLTHYQNRGCLSLENTKTLQSLKNLGFQNVKRGHGTIAYPPPKSFIQKQRCTKIWPLNI